MRLLSKIHAKISRRQMESGDDFKPKGVRVSEKAWIAIVEESRVSLPNDAAAQLVLNFSSHNLPVVVDSNLQHLEMYLVEGV